MESNGEKNKIHISKETADLLTAAGKDRWFVARGDKIVAKGKGELQTYWLNESTSRGSSNESTHTGSEISSDVGDDLALDDEDLVPQAKQILSEKYQRLVSWNAELLTRLLKEIHAKREANGVKADSASKLKALEQSILNNRSLVLDELVDIIRLPDCNRSVKKKNPDDIELGPKVIGQLHDYLTVLASYYRDNAFHNFEHVGPLSICCVRILAKQSQKRFTDLQTCFCFCPLPSSAAGLARDHVRC